MSLFLFLSIRLHIFAPFHMEKPGRHSGSANLFPAECRPLSDRAVYEFNFILFFFYSFLMIVC